MQKAYEDRAIAYLNNLPISSPTAEIKERSQLAEKQQQTHNIQISSSGKPHLPIPASVGGYMPIKEVTIACTDVSRVEIVKIYGTFC